jgi:outer membrane protein assembly factor BamD
LKYPKDPLAPQAEQRLREVQEVLGEGQYRVAYYYYMKGDRRATAGRLIPLVRRYPLYSKSDTALWMLGQIFEKSERKDIAGGYYAQIVKNYPLSSHAADAKGKLKDFGMPVPQADPKALEWMTAEQNTPRPHESPVHKPLGLLHPAPDVHMAATHGLPTLEPESDVTNYDILANGGRTTMVGTGSGTPGTGIVATVKPGEPTPPGTPTSGAATEDVNSTAGSDPQAGGTGSAAGDGTTPGNASQDSSSSADNTQADNTQPTTANSTQTQNQKESSSKKKGLKKILPW